MKRTDFELLAPAGDMEKLETAFHFGADAVYFGGEKFGLRAFATNFEDISLPVNRAHELGKKAYITLNIYPNNSDEKELITYIKYIEKVKPDGVIVSDIGVMDLVREYAPSVPLHVSTQANTTNKMSAIAYVKHFNAERIVLAREMSFDDIKATTRELKKVGAEVECFIHGAMCISYSGRCLLSNYLTGRNSNRGECVQACRWGYTLTPSEVKANEDNHKLEILEDSRGTYILNSKDLCLAYHMEELMRAGVKSFKIEGRMKSPYYVATVVNTYRKIIDYIVGGKKGNAPFGGDYITELEHSSHRKYTTGFTFDDNDLKQNYESSFQTQSADFLGKVLEVKEDGKIVVEMRNRFKLGDIVEVLSAGALDDAKVQIKKIETLDGESIDDAKRVQEKLILTLNRDLSNVLTPLDLLRSV